VEQPVVSGIAYSRDDAKVTLRRLPDRPGVAAKVFGALAKANVNVDMIVQNVGADGMTDMTFTVGKADLARAQEGWPVLQRNLDRIHALALNMLAWAKERPLEPAISRADCRRKLDFDVVNEKLWKVEELASVEPED
jgi:aspartokinase